MMVPLKKILYVDDDMDIQLVTTFALEELGKFTVQSCASGSEALACVTEFQPQLMILDVMMPGMDGPTTLGELRRLPVTAETPAVFMTAKVQTQEIADYKELGAIDVIVKPFDPMTLPDQVNNIWERYHEG